MLRAAGKMTMLCSGSNLAALGESFMEALTLQERLPGLGTGHMLNCLTFVSVVF